MEYIVHDFKVEKRDGTIVPFDITKITNAILRASEDSNAISYDHATRVAYEAAQAIDSKDEPVNVEVIQDIVEETLMDVGYRQIAKAYILYRNKRAEERKPDIFKYRKALKPYEYPELAKYVDAIRHSYWIHTEFNYTSDIHDYKVNVTNAERSALKNAMLAIAQVEVAVKTFWGNLYSRMPKPELGAVGATFSESESRHADAYSHLLEILGLNDEFEKIDEIPSLNNRVNYLTKSAKYAGTGEDKDYVLAVLLFSLFIEHVSLFSQFLVMMSFNKHKNLFKGLSNAIEATSKEEELHGQFGIDLINVVRQEHPEWFDEEMATQVYAACRESYEAEMQVIEWIYEEGDLDFIPKQVVKEFIKHRLNNSLESVGYDRIFEEDEEAVAQTDWFMDEIVATKHVDFFVKRSINYTKRAQSITGDDLF